MARGIASTVIAALALGVVLVLVALALFPRWFWTGDQRQMAVEAEEFLALAAAQRFDEAATHVTTACFPHLDDQVPGVESLQRTFYGDGFTYDIDRVDVGDTFATAWGSFQRNEPGYGHRVGVSFMRPTTHGAWQLCGFDVSGYS